MLDPNDPRRVIVTEMILRVQGQPDVRMALRTAKEREETHKNVYKVKEGAEYTVTIRFLVQGDVISGLKYLHSIKRKGIKGKPLL